MDKLNLVIDGVEVSATEGTTILEAATANGIYIPHLCFHPDLKPVGICRLCMVEIDEKRIDVSCKTPVQEGMRVRTETEELTKIRKVAVELLLANHPTDCLSCSENTKCDLQRVASYIGIDERRMKLLRRTTKTLEIDSSNPFFDYDPNRCVLCGICVRTCADIV